MVKIVNFVLCMLPQLKIKQNKTIPTERTQTEVKNSEGDMGVQVVLDKGT